MRADNPFGIGAVRILAAHSKAGERSHEIQCRYDFIAAGHREFIWAKRAEPALCINVKASNFGLGEVHLSASAVVLST
ncbi:hypothetical protein D3C79_874880 [compost metagenome]